MRKTILRQSKKGFNFKKSHEPVTLPIQTSRTFSQPSRSFSSNQKPPSFLSRWMNRRGDPAVSRLIDPKRTLFRADSRSLKEIQEAGGFLPREQSNKPLTKGDLMNYQIMNKNPGIVSTANSEEAAREIGIKWSKLHGKDHHIYRLKGKNLSEYPQSENIPLWQRLMYSEQDELMVKGGIPADKIEHIGTVTQDDEVPPSIYD